MSKAVQAPVQSRDGAVQPTIPAIAAEETGRPQWKPRTDGKSAVLVNPRTTVFDRRAPGLEPADPLDQVSDPIWNHKGFKTWTPDLVHCRLLVCGRTIFKLPQALRGGYVSQLGNIAISEIMAGRRMGADPAEISILDWTWPRLVRPVELHTMQRILMASAFGKSLDDIAKTMSSAGIKISKPTVGRWYHAEKLRLAADWQRSGHPVDQLTIRVWGELFDKGTK